jgi:hypothetical protein
MNSNDNLRGSINTAAAEQEQRQREIAVFADLIRQGHLSIANISASKKEAVREFLAGSGTGLSAQQFHARQQAERRKFFRERAAPGHKPHRVSQPDHDYIVGCIFDSVDAGTKPAVRPLLRAYGEERGYAPDWAERVSGKAQPRKMVRTLAAKKNHAVLKDLKEGRMLSHTHKSALQNATYSGLAELLFSGSQIVRTQRQAQERMAALETELVIVKAEAARINARLEIQESGKDWQEQARAIREVESAISNRELARRVGVHESTVRKYLKRLIEA